MPLKELIAQVKIWMKENDAARQFCCDPELIRLNRISFKLQTKKSETVSLKQAEYF